MVINMKISDIEKVAPNVLELARINMRNFLSSSDVVADDELEEANAMYLVAYAMKTESGMNIPRCRRLLTEYDRLKEIENNQRM